MNKFGVIIFALLMVFLIAFAQNVRAADTDNDGIDDSIDNCLGVYNSDQTDADDDGYGNWCDGDFNNDGVVNYGDLGSLRSNFGSDDPVTDLSSNGTVNYADLARFRALFGKPPGPSAVANFARLSWVAPTQNADGSPLTDLAGYQVYQSNDLTAPWTGPIEVTDTTILIDNLTTGTWHFRVRAFDASGNKNLSVFSPTGMKEIL